MDKKIFLKFYVILHIFFAVGFVLANEESMEDSSGNKSVVYPLYKSSVSQYQLERQEISNKISVIEMPLEETDTNGMDADIVVSYDSDDRD